MSRRSPLHRWLTALLGAWLVVSGGLAARGGMCSMHANAVVAAAGTAAHGGHAGHDMSHASGAHGSSHESGAPEPSPHHGCSCLTDCCGTAAVTLLASDGVTTRAVDLVATQRVVTPRVIRAPASARAHLLPFANGPPTTSQA